MVGRFLRRNLETDMHANQNLRKGTKNFTKNYSMASAAMFALLLTCSMLVVAGQNDENIIEDDMPSDKSKPQAVY
jgi:hypothetical protein